jgi:hypothetical protein
MEFLIVEDNGGKYRWTLPDREGNRLARSPRLASYEQEENAARVVVAGAGSARIDRRAVTDSSVEVPSSKKVPIAG